MVVPENMASVALDLRNTQSQISDIQQELIASGLGAEAKIIFDDVDEQIEPIIDRIRLDAMSGNISDMSSYESSISVLTDTRETLLSSLNLMMKELMFFVTMRPYMRISLRVVLLWYMHRILE